MRDLVTGRKVKLNILNKKYVSPREMDEYMCGSWEEQLPEDLVK